MSTIEIVCWCVVLAASVAGLAFKDARLYMVTLAASLVGLLLGFFHR